MLLYLTLQVLHGNDEVLKCLSLSFTCPHLPDLCHKGVRYPTASPLPPPPPPQVDWWYTWEAKASLSTLKAKALSAPLKQTEYCQYILQFKMSKGESL